MNPPLPHYSILGKGHVAIAIIMDLLYQQHQFEYTLEVVNNLDNDPDRDIPFDSIGLHPSLVQSKDWIPRQGNNHIIGAFQPGTKQKIEAAFLRSHGIHAHQYTSLVHLSAAIAQSVQLGAGSIVGPQVSIAPFTTLGKHVSVNRNVSIGHHTNIGDYSTINPGAHIAGMITIGDSVLIGMGALVLERLTIGSHSIIAAGSVVTKPVPEGVLVMGTPAQVVKTL